MGVWGRFSLAMFVLATGLVQLLPALPSRRQMLVLTAVLALVACVALALAWRGRMSPGWAVVVLMAGIGFLLAAVRAESRLSDQLALSNQNLVSRVHVRVVGLPQRDVGGWRFDVQTLSSVPDGVPSRIRVSWPEPGWGGPYARSDGRPSAVPQIVPGQVWRMALVLKPPHGSRNPGGFDYEGHVFAGGVRATGTVRGSPQLLDDHPWHSFTIMAQRARYHVRQGMLPYLEGKRYGAVLLALAIGDQASVESSDWVVFNRTGITHLVSISGTHVTLIAGLGAWLVSAVWRRARFRGRFLAERIPAQVVAAPVALVIAGLYCLLAGWGVPAQRTFLMLAVVAITYMLRRPVDGVYTLLLAASVVVLLDPWAMVSVGFWLSFMAVAVLMGMAASAMRTGRDKSVGRYDGLLMAFRSAVHIQLGITVALLPILAFLFNEVSVVSPLANGYAIPMISLVITPLALLIAMLAVIPNTASIVAPLTELTHSVLRLVMWPTEALAELPLASLAVAQAPPGLFVLAFLGLLIALLPRGLPGKRLGWLLIVPALCSVPGRPGHGEWDAYALDVGQAGAIVIRTRNHTVLFDSGVRHHVHADSGDSVILPFLRTLGVQKLDGLVLSHADIDHVGGLRTVLDAMRVTQSHASFSVGEWLKREARSLGVPGVVPLLPRSEADCHAGQSWQLDGVEFEMLWPPKGTRSAADAASRERNDNSCVLSIVGVRHSLLLTGDINSAQEHELVKRGLNAYDAVMAPHHGSRGSSSAEFIHATRAAHVIIQAGAWSRYGHPHPQTLDRWTKELTEIWRTDQHGAITLRSRADAFIIYGERQMHKRYWQGR